MHVLLATSELHPFSKTGGLADMVAALGNALAARGIRATIVTPAYRGVRERFPQIADSNWNFDIRLGDELYPGRFARLSPRPNLDIWFVEQPFFFDRKGIYNEATVDYPDNALRYLFLSKAAILLARHLPHPPDVIHSHDWQTGLIPLLVHHARLTEHWHKAPPCIFTIHNLAYQGWFPATHWPLTNLPEEWFHADSAWQDGQVNFMKAALNVADAITTVSPTYAREIVTPEYGCGLERLLQRRGTDVHGILNGVDYEEWNTVANPALPASYGANDLGGKVRCKAALQEALGLPVRDDIPLLANVSRLTSQKGSELILEAIPQVLRSQAFQFVLLGSGDPALEKEFLALAAHYPRQVSVTLKFDPALSHRIEAAADFYLMPSRFEPCGLNQLYSLRYGSIPVVRATGGLQDSVTDPREDLYRATGIKFNEYATAPLVQAIRKALALYPEKDLLQHFRRNGMTADFSWEKQATDYVALYRTAGALG
ncbi:MAG TPA: glycogen synthase GlgA [Candidatus Limnocylindria bacterium]|jgi:starch synthase|nr:glycogen synthase GlgA [Candidatus Limnocylindria bacterium]